MMRVELDSQVLRALIARQCETSDIAGVALVLESRLDTFKCVPTAALTEDSGLCPIFEFAHMDFPDDVLGAPATEVQMW
ncbi:MAG: hypothetical protein CFE26_23320, partial [Verrucomicrobiales bacterium VVV1]